MPRRPEDAQRTHAMDTLIALARDMAPVVGAFYRGLRDDGMDRADALVLSGKFLRHLFGQVPKP